MVVDAVCVGPDREQHLFAAGQRYVAVALLAMAGHVNRVVRGAGSQLGGWRCGCCFGSGGR